MANDTFTSRRLYPARTWGCPGSDRPGRAKGQAQGQRLEIAVCCSGTPGSHFRVG
jgi:hypothetical protein